MSNRTRDGYGWGTREKHIHLAKQNHRAGLPCHAEGRYVWSVFKSWKIEVTEEENGKGAALLRGRLLGLDGQFYGRGLLVVLNSSCGV
jgi:hypothetical protein